MSSHNVLEVLKENANQQLSAISQQLASLQHQRQQAVEQQQLLHHYHQDYQQLLHHEATAGIYRYRQDNYHAFLQTVDHALALQSQAVETLDHQQQQLLTDWQLSRKKMNALQILIERREQRLRHQQRRLQQKENDEFAQRRFQGTE